MQGIGVILAIVLGFIGFYYSQQQTFWLYGAATIVALLAIWMGITNTPVQGRALYVVSAILLIVGAGTVGFIRGSEVSGSRPSGATNRVVVSSTFDTDTEGWTLKGGAENLSHIAQGGQPGGYVRAQDLEGDHEDWFWQAPPKFLGDQSVAYEGLLRFKLAQNDITTPYTATDDVVLVGEALTLYYKIDTPGTGWTRYSVPLVETVGWRKGDDTAPTEAEMRRVLSSLRALYIRGEHKNGPDVGNLDEVFLLRLE
jgi:hypothetical protein